jgi:hypothetical protein
MATWLRQSTAVDVALGPFVDATDGVTPETALTITQAETRLKKNNGAWAQKNQVSSATHEEEGWYEVVLDATDTNTLGILELAVYIAGALPAWREFLVVPAAVYDSIVAGTDTLPVDAIQWLGAAIAAPTIAGVPEVDVTHAAGAAQASIATQASVNTIDDFLDTEIAAILAAVDTEVAAIKAKTDNLPAAPAAVGDIPTAAQNAAGLLDLADAIEVGLTARGTLRLLAAAMAAKLSGAGTGTEVFRNAVADTKDRITATVDIAGNRSAIVTDVT